MTTYTSFSSFTPLTVIVRVAQPSDLGDLVEVLFTSFYPQTDWMQWCAPLLRLGLQEDLRQRLRSMSPQSVLLVALLAEPPRAAEKVVGTIEITLQATGPFQPRDRTVPYLSNLAVHPLYRRRGVAHQLLRASEETVRDRGFRAIHLHVMEDNHSARQLYSAAGYRLQQAEMPWYCWLFRNPQKLLLSKQIDRTE